MATLVGAGNATATSVTIPSHQAGDLLIVVAIKWGSGTPTPTVPSGWKTAHTSTNTYRRVVGWKIATSSSEVSGTWTNAGDLWVMVWRDATIGAVASAAGTLTATPALTLTSPPAHVVALGTAAAAGTASLPAGMTSLWTSSGTYIARIAWTASPVSSWAATSITNTDTSTVLEIIPASTSVAVGLSGDGLLTTTSTPAIPAAINLTGAGQLTTATAASITITTALTGTGGLSAVGEVQALQVALGGDGALHITATVEVTATAGLAGGGTLAAIGDTTQRPAPEWADEVTAHHRIIDYRAEAVTTDGAHIGDIPITGARISFDGTQTEQWGAAFTFADPDLVPYSPTSWLDGRSGVRLRVWWRLHTDSGILERPVCTLCVEDPSGTDDGILAGAVPGLDPLAIARRGGYGSRTISVGGMTVSDALTALFDALVPDWPVSIEPSGILLPTVYDLWEREPAEDWAEIAGMAGMTVRTDRMGVITAARPEQGDLVADWREGPTCPIIDIDWQQKTSTIPRRVVVVTTNPDVTPPIVGVWEHPDATSMQIITETRIESSTVTTQEGADALAKLSGERWARRQLAVTVTVPQRPDLDYRSQVLMSRMQSQIHGTFEVAGWELVQAGRDAAPALMSVRLMTRLEG